MKKPITFLILFFAILYNMNCSVKPLVENGVDKEYYRSGSLLSEIHYSNGKKEGTAKWYYKNGNVKVESNYKEGKLHGITKKYYDNGALRLKTVYKDGEIVKKNNFNKSENVKD